MKTQTQTELIDRQAASGEQMNIVVIGHVDHGKSTVVGRLLADTGSLPNGKLEEVKARCARNSKPFEYAFLLDALKDEQAQGITIDSARCFFQSSKREYIIIDAPGHIEFLKNMISGAARAEAAVLVIDAKEGVRENSRRHGYLLSMLGIRQVVVVVNKLDLVDYSESVFESIREEYSQFLKQINTEARTFIPAAAREGVNIVSRSETTGWYNGPTVLEALDEFEKEAAPVEQPLRFPVQDVYKFTEHGDDRRVIAGRIETGRLEVGDDVVFLPSGKKSAIASIESFNLPIQKTASAGQSTGITLTEQIYVTAGEIICKAEQPQTAIGTHLKVNIFWMGRQPMIKGKRYKLKIGTARIAVWLRQIVTVLDASELTTDSNKQQVERHDVAECVLETLKPIAFDLTTEVARTSRFVIIDNYEIAGGGVILENLKNTADRISEGVRRRQHNWERSAITTQKRLDRYKQHSTLILVTGAAGVGKKRLAKTLEEQLFESGRMVYYLGLNNSLYGIDADIESDRDEYLRRLGEISHLFTDAGLILITTVSELDDYEFKMIRQLNHPNDCLLINIGARRFSEAKPDMQLEPSSNVSQAAQKICDMLTEKKYIIEYYL
ncbi:MAG: GTP-binding protein [Phycisphaerae bacterium]|nr:GTP-binding protein [Phycisphaerae bacterium]